MARPLILFASLLLLATAGCNSSHRSPSSSPENDPQWWSWGSWSKYFGSSHSEERPNGTSQHPANSPKSECRSTYERFFKNETLRITVALGFMDTGWDDTANYDVEDSIRTELTGDEDLCKGGTHPFICGFQQDPTDSRVFTKKIQGPDGATKTLRVNIVSAVTHNQPQDQVSAGAEKDFLESLNSSEAVIYIGHSRKGGGPDFNPPKLLQSGDRNYPWYEKNRPGFKAIEEKLRQSTHHPQLLALLSCSSGQHFASILGQLAPDTALIVSENEEEFFEQENSFYGTLNGLIGMECRDDFVKGIQFSDKSSDEPTKLELIGFFQ